MFGHSPFKGLLFRIAYAHCSLSAPGHTDSIQNIQNITFFIYISSLYIYYNGKPVKLFPIKNLILHNVD